MVVVVVQVLLPNLRLLLVQLLFLLLSAPLLVDLLVQKAPQVLPLLQLLHLLLLLLRSLALVLRDYIPQHLLVLLPNQVLLVLHHALREHPHHLLHLLLPLLPLHLSLLLQLVLQIDILLLHMRFRLLFHLGVLQGLLPVLLVLLHHAQQPLPLLIPPVELLPLLHLELLADLAHEQLVELLLLLRIVLPRLEGALTFWSFRPAPACPAAASR